MRPGRRFGLSAEQKIDVWRRWKAGETLHEIGRAFGKEHSSLRCLVVRHGGIVPAVRRRTLLAHTLREREEISRGLASGSSFREIARCLERAVSTVSREVARHGGRPAYRASQADDEAWRFKAEQIVTLLRQIEVEIANGKTTPQACRDAQITVQTFYRWRKEYGGLKLDQAKRLKDLEKENSKLNRLVAELSLEKQILKDVAEGNF
jgi:hypothetical protein